MKDPEEATNINKVNKKRTAFVMKHGLRRSADEEMDPRGGAEPQGGENPAGMQVSEETFAAKIRRGTRDRREDQGDEMIMEVMCEEHDIETDKAHEEDIDEYNRANLEENFEWGQHPKMSWADMSEEQVLTKIYDNVTGQELDHGEVMKAA